MQQRQDRDAIFLGSIYVIPTMQGKESARTSSGRLSTWQEHGPMRSPAVMKMNPAVSLDDAVFRVTSEDEYKVYMRAGD